MEKLKEFFKQRENQLLVLVLIVALTIRLYFFFKTYNQALWWDEADYMSIAKHYGFGTPEVAAPWRARGMSLIFGIFYFFGANEIFQRLIVIAFSVATVWLTYLLGKEFYNRKVALIASIFMSVLWTHLFWTTRFSGEVFALVFFGFAGLFFWRGYVKNKSKWYMIACGALIAYGIFLYESVGAIFVFLAGYLLVTERLAFFKNKQFWWGMLGLILVLIPIFWHYYDLYGQIYPRAYHVLEGSLSQGTELDQKLATQGGWSVFITAFSFIYGAKAYFLWTLLILTIIGLWYYIDLILGFDMLVKTKEPRLQKDFYVLWWALCILLLFGTYLAVTNAYFEERYIFPAYPLLFIIAARGLVGIADVAEKYKKHLGKFVIILVILFAGYEQLTYASAVIDYKKGSFSQERPAGDWLKEHTEPGDILLACSQVVPLVYYSEREAITYRYNTTEVDEQIRDMNVKYLIVDLYIQDCNVNYAMEREKSGNLTLVGMYSEGQYPTILVYETKGYE